MKRSWCLWLWIGLIVFTILCVPISRIHAADPTPTAATTPDPLQGALEVPEGIPITRASLTLPGIFDKFGLSTIGFTLTTTLAKLGFQVPDFKAQGMLQRMEAGIAGTTDSFVQDHATDPGVKIRYSTVFEFCPTPQPGEALDREPSPKISRLVTDVSDQGSTLYNDAKIAGSTFAPNYSLELDANGNFLRAPKDVVVATSPAPGCDINETGVPATPTPVPILAGGSILASFTRVFNIIFFPKQTTSIQESTPIAGYTKQTGDKFTEKMYAQVDDPHLSYAGEPESEVANDQQTPGGIYDTFLTAKPTTSYSSNQQPLSTSIITNTIGGKILDLDTAFHCAITNEGDPDHPPASACEAAVPNQTTTPESGSVCAIADKYKIPCCQLQGILQVETGDGTFPIGKGTCTRNGTVVADCCTGNFCGPANISCNQYTGLDSGDNLQMCTDTGAAELLARAMLIAKCQADSNLGTMPAPAPVGTCQRYNWALDGSYILKYYNLEQICNKTPNQCYTAAAYYYGLNNGCVVDECSQFRWGNGKSYCDAVAGYCPGGTPLINATDVSHCVACNQTIPVGSPKIDCSEYR